MTWMNNLQLRKRYTDPGFQTAFAQLFTLRLFLSECLLSSGYKPPDAFGDAIFLSSAGTEWVPRIQNTVTDISLAEIKLALFLKFFHHELFVDVTATNPTAIQKVLDAEIVDRRIRYPWVYGRLLYDRFFDMSLGQPKKLSYEETIRLLQDTPQGVFQVRDVLVGPFGVLNSSCHRFLPPVQTVPLWHCSDPSCYAIHPVRLSTGESKVSQAISFISIESEKANGTASEWDKFFFDFTSRPGYYYDDMHPQRFPWLLVTAFSEREIRNILRRLIDQHSKEMRQRFPRPTQFGGILSGSAEKISEGMTKAQCFQLILLMSDEIVAGCAECLIESGEINIPSTEIRTARTAYRGGGAFNVTCQCSQFGIRFVPAEEDIALARLKILIKEIYKQEQDLANLHWRLRHLPGETVYERLDTYVHTEDPKRVVSNLVFASPEKIQRAFKLLRYGWFALPSCPTHEKRLVEKILWKLGFNIGLYPAHQMLFWERLEKLLDTARTCDTYNENDREVIRSTGVNLFVSLEEILDYSLSFTTWALFSDHYAATKFKFNFNEARKFMALRLSGRRLGSNEPLEFDAGGRNTLYPLIKGFAILADLCSEIIADTNSDLGRAENEFPGYCGKTGIEIFPFRHKVLLLDLRAGDRDRVIELLREITGRLEKYQVCDIRNRIEHRRPDFPSREEIEAACGAVADAINKMETAGVCPLIYLYTGRTTDQYRRSLVTFKDYKSREITIRQPSQYRLCGLPSIQVPQVIVPWMHIGDSFELMRFQFEETSDYVKMWQEYPKRRLQAPVEELKEDFGPAQR